VIVSRSLSMLIYSNVDEMHAFYS